MLPQFDVDVEIGAIDPGMLRVIWIADVLADGVGDNRQYEDLTGVPWSEVQAVITEEEELVREAEQRASTPDEFDALFDDVVAERYPGGDLDEGPLERFSMLDIGVMSAVAGLSAAGCISTTSCRGHSRVGEPTPLVRFTTDEPRIGLIVDAAADANCGLVVDPEGMLQLYAKDVRAFMSFAGELLRRRDAFDRIETAVALERPSVYEGDFETEVRRRDLPPPIDLPPANQMSLFEPDFSSGGPTDV